MSAFDLTREPWIPVETDAGAVFERSTREVLRDAHALRGLYDPSPLVVAALTRHLLAVLYRVYDGPKTIKAWCEIARAKRFDPVRIDAYLDRVAPRMDLFHPTHPFGQARGLATSFAKYTAPIDELEVTRSEWGPGRALFRHRPDDPPLTLSAARAARALLAHHAFATGGLIRKPGEPVAASAAPLVRAGVVILRGRTLFETLISNLIVYDPERSFPIPSDGTPDAPSWEQAPPPAQLLRADEPKRRPHGYLDLLTWLSRRVELAHEGHTVTGFINAVWTGLDENAPRDPMVAWRRHEKLGFLSVGINPERAFWRDANALFIEQKGKDDAYDRPAAVTHVARQEVRALLGQDILYAVEVHGIAAEKSRVDAVRREGVYAAAKVFDDPDARIAVRESIERAEKLVDALYLGLRAFAESALTRKTRDPDAKEVNDLIKSFGAKAEAWSALGEAFNTLLRTLGEDPVRAQEAFNNKSYWIVHDLFEAILTRSDDTRLDEAAVPARKVFRDALPRRRNDSTTPTAMEAQP